MLNIPYKKILITGGAGFVGSNLSIFIKNDFPATEVVAFDNLKRRGSELNLIRLKESGTSFIHGDIRSLSDLESVGSFDLLIDCSAEPSVLAGYEESPKYLIDTNLLGTTNCLEQIRKFKADLIFLSTSRVYSTATINKINFIEDKTRFLCPSATNIKGLSNKGIAEDFPIDGPRSLYGTTKLASELLIEEYKHAFNLNAIINRCGVIAGPWQMGKVDQGVIVLWIAKHIMNKSLSYFGYGWW